MAQISVAPNYCIALMEGLLAVWKPRGMSSQHLLSVLSLGTVCSILLLLLSLISVSVAIVPCALQKLKRCIVSPLPAESRRAAFKSLRAGHSGTLDPQAEGVLVVALGRLHCRKLSRFLGATTKTYEVSAELGVCTDTREVDGRVIDRAQPDSWQHLQLDQANALLRRDFLGERMQRPPIYSALHIAGSSGKRGYQLARRASDAESVEKLASTLTLRRVVLHAAEIFEWAPPLFRMRIEVGSGFYVRSLVHDFGAALGCGAVVTRLVRTRIAAADAALALPGDPLEWKPSDVEAAIARAHPLLDAHGCAHVSEPAAALPPA